MAQVINTNVSSLTAQRNLNKTGGALQTSLQRLSSGLRINSAKDDSAGLAISERMTSQIRGFNQAARNANDGISFSQTAEGALSTVTNNMQRIRELAVQSANATNNADDRASLDKEVQTLIQEIGRIANQTEFNNSNILDGTLKTMFFQIGANQGQTIAVESADSRPTQLGTSEAVGQPGLTQAQIQEFAKKGATGAVTDLTITINSNPAVGITVKLDNKDIRSLDDMVREINAQISKESRDNPTIQDANLKASLRVLDDGNSTIVINGAFAPPTFEVTGGDINPPALNPAVELFNSASTADQINLTELNIKTRENAYKTIGAIDGALDQVRGFRAEFGAAQSRFEATISNLQVSAESASAARSRIRDTDFAAETAELTKVQILIQSGTSVLSQANAAPQSVLSLLQQ